VEAEYTAGASQLEQMPPPNNVELAFAGRSNVGKSSLLNALMDRRRLVRTSSTPGCTRKINFFLTKARDGAVLTLVDLPGYGYAKRSKTERKLWSQLIEAYLIERDHLRAVVVLVDARRGLSEADQQLVDFVAQRKEPRPAVIVVATKIDKVPKSKQAATLKRLGALGVSAVTGAGLQQLWSELRQAALG
jgi:GTP-binding protein